MPSDKAESSLLKLIPIILSLVALFVSSKSCIISKKALDHSEKVLFYDHRPYLMLTNRLPELAI